jgi:hypothetical protein
MHLKIVEDAGNTVVGLQDFMVAVTFLCEFFLARLLLIFSQFFVIYDCFFIILTLIPIMRFIAYSLWTNFVVSFQNDLITVLVVFEG